MSVSFFGVAETGVTGPRGPAGPQPTISTYIGTYHTLAGVAQIMSNFPSGNTPSNGKISINKRVVRTGCQPLVQRSLWTVASTETGLTFI